MKNWLLIFLTIHILASTLPVGYAISICRLSNLITHFYQHRSEAKGNDLFHFFSEHYSRHKHFAEDHTTHKSLPFHSAPDENGKQSTPQSPISLPLSESIPLFSKKDTHSNKLTITGQQWLSSLFADDIWQPPKA